MGSLLIVASVRKLSFCAAVRYAIQGRIRVNCHLKVLLSRLSAHAVSVSPALADAGEAGRSDDSVKLEALLVDDLSKYSAVGQEIGVFVRII